MIKNIFINGRPAQVVEDTLTYEQIVSVTCLFAAPTHPTVTYSKGGAPVLLVAGESVAVAEGMGISVVDSL